MKILYMVRLFFILLMGISVITKSGILFSITMIGVCLNLIIFKMWLADKHEKILFAAAAPLFSVLIFFYMPGLIENNSPIFNRLLLSAALGILGAMIFSALCSLAFRGVRKLKNHEIF